MNREHKYKDEYKDHDKDKEAKRITESLTVCYIFGILMFNRKNDIRGCFEAARNFFFTPESNQTLI